MRKVPGDNLMLIIEHRVAFHGAFLDLPAPTYGRFLNNCVWDAPNGFSVMSALRPVYGSELCRLFREVLKVPNASATEALKYLHGLRAVKSTSMADVAGVYSYIHRYRTET